MKHQLKLKTAVLSWQKLLPFKLVYKEPPTSIILEPTKNHNLHVKDTLDVYHSVLVRVNMSMCQHYGEDIYIHGRTTPWTGGSERYHYYTIY